MKSEPLSPTLDGYVEQAGDQADFDDNLVRVRVAPKQRDVSSYTQNRIYLMEFNIRKMTHQLKSLISAISVNDLT